jgi:two-component system OmpR family response regulator
MLLATKILLITADDSMASSIRTCLTDSGYKVIHISRGVEALDVIHIEIPALVVLDINLPDFNSLAIVRSIRSDGVNDQIPIILFGSNIIEEDVLIGLETGADLYLLEAFHPQVFVARVRSLLRRCELVKAD